MQNNFIIYFVSISLLALQQPVITTKQSQILLFEGVNSRLEILKYAMDVMIMRIELLERKTEKLWNPFIEYNKTTCEIYENNNEILRSFINDTYLIKLNQRNISEMFYNLAKELKENLKVNEIETTTIDDDTETSAETQDIAMNGDVDTSDILNEILKKQTSLETIFQLILEGSEKTNAAEFIKNQFKELGEFIKTQKRKFDKKTLQQKSVLHDEHLNCLQNCNNNSTIYVSCEAALASNAYNEGVYLLKIPNSDLKPFYACCDAYNGLIIQRREDGSQDFYRNWQDYKAGFGDVFGEYWIGLERLHAITSSGKYQIFIMLEDYRPNTLFAKYLHFRIGNEEEGYPLLIHSYSGTAVNALKNHNGLKFSTYDRDNDNTTTNCARYYKGAWWYRSCYTSNLNGRYYSFAERRTPHGIVWAGSNISKKSVYMAIKPSI